MQWGKGEMFASFVVGFILCGAALTGVYFGTLRQKPEQPDLPQLAAISEEEATRILQSRQLPEWEVRAAARRTAFFGRNLQFLALKEKYRDLSAWPFSKADVPVMEEWLRRHWKPIWARLLREADIFNFSLHLDEYDLQDVACTWTYRSEPIDATSRWILENSLTVMMTLTVKDAVHKEDLRWPSCWGYIASVKLSFVMEKDTVRSVTIDVDDRRARDEFHDPIDHGQLQRAMTGALQTIFRSDGHSGWVYLSQEKETGKYHWKGIP